MSFQGTNGQVAFVGWDNTNKEWKFVQRPIVYENGSLFDYRSCSERIEIDIYEYVNYDFNLTQINFDIFKPAVPDGKFTFKVGYVLNINDFFPRRIVKLLVLVYTNTL